MVLDTSYAYVVTFHQKPEKVMGLYKWITTISQASEWHITIQMIEFTSYYMGPVTIWEHFGMDYGGGLPLIWLNMIVR